jgi:hypothetical protein
MALVASPGRAGITLLARIAVSQGSQEGRPWLALGRYRGAPAYCIDRHIHQRYFSDWTGPGGIDPVGLFIHDAICRSWDAPGSDRYTLQSVLSSGGG